MWNFCWCGPENPDVEHSRDSNPHPYTHAPQPLAWTSVRTFAPTVRRAASLPAWYMKCNKFRYLCIIYVVIWYFSPKQKNEKRRAMAGRTSTSTSTSRTMARSRARSRTSQLGQPWHRVNITHFHWLCVCVCVCVKTHKLHLQPLPPHLWCVQNIYFKWNFSPRPCCG